MSENPPETGPVLNAQPDSSDKVIFIRRKNFVILQFRGDTEKIEKEEINNVFSYMMQKPQHLVVDCLFITKISQNIAVAMGVLRQQLVMTKNLFKLTHLAPSLQAQFQKFPFIKENFFADSFRDFIRELKDYQKSPPQTPLGLRKGITLAAIKAFYLEFHLPINIKEVYYEEETQSSFTGEYSSLSYIILDDSEFLLCLSFPKETFTSLAKVFYDIKEEEIEQEHHEALRLFLHFIWEWTQQWLEARGHKIKFKYPSIHLDSKYPEITPWRGKFENFDVTKSNKIIFPFRGPLGKFCIEIVFPEHINNEIIQKILEGDKTDSDSSEDESDFGI